MLENKFKTGLIRELKERFPGCMVVHLDPNEIQGIPDLLVLYGTTWGALEGKKSASAPHRPNQDYYVQQMDEISAEKGNKKHGKSVENYNRRIYERLYL